ncbi:4'-phosphopantetheinyl transferase family protein [Cryobacterium tagatosivorans]|uniref:4'-phosphopantetheinyl transferase superfamily protein n=1 Tax=Cryobacterium tagatosivorans TaxID=1259199 RepID=A0A4R8UFG7_9MICO|nr:4'-phosphopantetheinyl transferase superfamily protein [Cryobacterium tagatosivorans]TFB52821.1 4'-phosphopantetheinyl transferase superfamily protein [Cryobacterium tagatosivorans]
MVDKPTMDVFVFVGERASINATDRRLLVDAVAWVSGEDRRTISIEQRCEHCSGKHGRPVVVAPAGPARDLHVSLSRAGRLVAVAVTFAGPVGVDIESPEAVARSSFDDVAFGAAERAGLLGREDSDADWARAFLWTSKEAALKATGTGLRSDPRAISVSVPRRGTQGHPAIEVWRDADFPVETMNLTHFEPGEGLVGTVAVLAPTRPEVRLFDASAVCADPKAGLTAPGDRSR